MKRAQSPARASDTLLHVAFHGHFGGRPLMTAMFDKLLAFLSAQSDVHFFPGR
jgi:hypothetical protein